ncbi:polysaccharide biosynthesis protein [Kineothrix alysoides]|uniref:Polysaccharide biosynthesis protein n=1 Tax=Kineothrix alysoides TaxID=1469948 RepID=A0A4R1QXA8_9FIRM|nr:SDR family NAD(P)-dependent oxidoreductase [Kineothrix alysoides]TCL56194.1 polysaccharide biosynthesis protein [Kineothrix alysoides]
MYNAAHKYQIICDRIDIGSNMDIKNLLYNQIILITGGGGSIGKELCKKIIQYNPKKIIVFDVNELSLFTMSNDFSEEIEKDIITLTLGSVLDYKLIEHIFQKYQPNIIIHAAAYKHVPIAEKNPSEAIKCNVLGTLNMLNAAIAFSIKHFIYLSSDKAVNPSSVMGVTKRIGEILVKYFNSLTSSYYTIVRFGNVFQSSGSVSEIFIEQLFAKKKITITHPDMKRYFMSISDAVSLILSSAVLYNEGDLFLCDMKQSVRITDLAKEIIKMLGIDYHEVEIQYTSVREGESLFEELCYSTEILRKSSIENIYICESQEDCHNILERVYDLLQHLYAEDLLDYIRRIVPQYQIEKKPNSKKRNEEAVNE